ncbi:MAG: hypothetical protein IJ313_10600 [Clostridia bacterium]|nr:hypothetical protein [Clostridia bacterium]
MAEFTNSLLQTVAVNGNVVFTETPVRGNNCVVHREGSGIATLRGWTNQDRALYRVSFGANIAVPVGGTAGEISLAIAVENEPLASATMIETPAAVEEFANVYAAVLVSVPRGCCFTVSVRNTSDQAINVQNANMIVDRIA